MTDDNLDGLYARAPRDVVPTRGLDRETLLALNAAALTNVRIEEAGEVTEDVDGIPAYVGPPTITTGMLGRTAVLASQLRAAGVDPAEVPNLHIIERK